MIVTRNSRCQITKIACPIYKVNYVTKVYLISQGVFFWVQISMELNTKTHQNSNKNYCYKAY